MAVMHSFGAGVAERTLYGGRSPEARATLPITAKLSREFYERFGNRVVNEMVDLFNRIDDSARLELRQLNEANTSRIEARIDQRVAELRADVDGRISRLEARVDALADRLSRVESTVERMDRQLATIPAQLEKSLHNQTRYIIGAWGILLASQIALWLR